MVKSPLFVDPASGGRPASLRKASRVYRTKQELLVSIAQAAHKAGRIYVIVMIRFEKSCYNYCWRIRGWHGDLDREKETNDLGSDLSPPKIPFGDVISLYN